MEYVGRMSKSFLIGAYLGGIILSILVPFASIFMFPKPEWFILSLLLGLLFRLLSFLTMIIFIYDMWRVIQDGHARTTPGMAAGLLFVPIFNVYWVFPAVWGLAKDFNAYIERYHINTKPLSEKLFLAYPASVLFSLLYSGNPILGILAGITVLVHGTIIIARGCDAANVARNVAA